MTSAEFDHFFSDQCPAILFSLLVPNNRKQAVAFTMLPYPTRRNALVVAYPTYDADLNI